MDAAERTSLAILMDSTAASYAGGTIDPAHAVKTVKNSLTLIDRHRETLPENIRAFHESFMRAMSDRNEEYFMFKVLSQCCIYKAEVF